MFKLLFPSHIYCLVRSILEYGSVVWSPFYAVHKRLEAVQNRFCKFVLYKHHFPYKNVPYNVRLQLVGISSLEQRRKNAMVFFLHKLINGHFNCESLLGNVFFKVSQRPTRQNMLFYERPHRTNYGFRRFTDLLVRNYNNYFNNIDLFRYSFLCFKNRVVSG